ncbi:MAG: hypothetical protein PHI85_06420 [Victivallaceae bacterium]|nr:hypothetical protein [Victivallaceae bacterium]
MNRGNAGSKPVAKFAIGYFFNKKKPFVEIIEKYLPHIAEIYFPWPGLLSARQIHVDNGEMLDALTADLKWCREHRLALDLLMNATCYGDAGGTVDQQLAIGRSLEQMDKAGLLPEVVTTTSPFVARVIKMAAPQIEIRASVNMRLNSTLAMEYISDFFDSFYMGRDLQRDLPTLKHFSKWCTENGKKLCLLANSGCLRNCPWQTFHETLLAHDFQRAFHDCRRIDVPSVLCSKMFKERRFVEFLRASWIRPEDLHRVEPYVAAIKLSTRDVPDPELIIKAYTERKFNGNLFKLIDPGFSNTYSRFSLDNTAFPPDWFDSGIAGLCAINCTHCGRCEQVMDKVLREKPLPTFALSADRVDNITI